MQPPDEHHAPDPVLIRFLMTMRRLAPEKYDDAIAAVDLPLTEHGPACVCPAHLAAALASRSLPPDPFTDTEEPCTMAKTKTTTQVILTTPCRKCGRAVPVGRGWDAARPHWRTCPEHRKPMTVALVPEALAALGIEDDPTDPAVRSVFASPWFLADRSPQHRSLLRADGILGQAGFLGQLVPASPRGSGTPEPWSHLDARDVRRRIKQARADLDLAGTALPNEAGRGCWGCGVAKATEWVDVGDRRANDLLMCGPCAFAWERSGGDDASFARRLVARALTAEDAARPVRPSMSLDAFGMKPYSAAPGADPKGYNVPWGYIPDDLLEQVRQAYWAKHPQHAPAEMRVRLERVARARALVGPRPTAPAPVLSMPGRS